MPVLAVGCWAVHTAVAVATKLPAAVRCFATAVAGCAGAVPALRLAAASLANRSEVAAGFGTGVPVA